MPRQPFYGLWIGVTVELLGVLLMSRHGNFLERGDGGRFAALAVMAGAGFFFAVRGLQRADAPARSIARWFWIVAVVMRVAALPTFPSDDFWRYRWEGNVQLHGFNPYLLPPDSAALVGLRDVDWGRINHRDFPAIYPPLAEGMFAVLARGGNSLLGYKLLFAVADLGVAAILRRLLVCGGRPPEAAAWYAWNPLAIYAGAGAAHFDCLMIVATMGAVWCLDRLPTETTCQSGAALWRVPLLAWASAVLLGVAIALKAVPLVLLPTWFFALGWRRAVLTLPLAVGIAPALALPYGFPDVSVFEALGRFAQGFRVNDAVWWIVDPGDRLSRTHGVLAVTVCCLLAFWWRRDWRRGALWVMGAALLLGPALHAWYVLWVLPLAVWRGGRAGAWVVLSISVFGYFLLWEVNHASGKPWEEPLWLRLLIYLPPVLALGWSFVVRPSGSVDRAQSCYG